MHSAVKTRNIAALLRGWSASVKRRAIVELVEVHPTVASDLGQFRLLSRVA